MQITTQDIGAFFSAAGEQMIQEPDVCLGAILDTPSSKKEIINRMTTNKNWEVDPPVARAIVEKAAQSHGDVAQKWWNAFGDISL